MNIGNIKLEQMFWEDYDFNLKPSLKTSDFFQVRFCLQKCKFKFTFGNTVNK